MNILCSIEETLFRLLCHQTVVMEARDIDIVMRLELKNGTRYLCLLPDVGVFQWHLPTCLPSFLCEL